MRVVDTHLHFWIQSAIDYPWLTETDRLIFRDFEPAEVIPQLASAAIDSVVLVQSANSYKDTEAMFSQADEFDWVEGVVGWVPLTDRAETSRKLEEWGAHPKFCGIRALNHVEADASWMVLETVLDSLVELEQRDVPFDVVAVFPNHLEHVPTIAKSREGLRIVVDHLANPPIASGDLSVWRDQMQKAAEHPNVYAKVSGLNTSVGKEDWTSADFVPAIAYAIGAFGVDRLMFGSNWPVSILNGTYQRVWDETLLALDRLGLNVTERAAILGGTAARFYGLKENT